MLKKFTLTLFILAVTFNFASAQYRLSPQQKANSKTKEVKVVYFDDAVTAEDVLAKLRSGEIMNKINSSSPVTTQSLPFQGMYAPAGLMWTSAVFTLMGGTTLYPQQSNGTPVQIWQDPNTPDNIHAVFTTNPTGEDQTFPGRRTKYFFSSDRGTTWSDGTTVPDLRSGFAAITGLSDGKALIVNHNGPAAASTRCRLYVDVLPGIGVFSEIDPNNGVTNQRIWGRIVATQNVSLTNKYVLAASVNITNYDSTFITRGTSLSGATTFTGWEPINSNSAEAYQLARGTDGRIGLAYISQDTNTAGTERGDVFFRESTDNGTTFSAAVKIYDANPDADGSGALRGLSIVYLGNVPKVAFDIARIAGSSYYPGLQSRIGFWSPSVNGGTAKIMVDSTDIFAGPRTTPYNVLTPIGRVSIGSSKDGSALFATFMAQDTVYGVNVADTTSFSFLYFTMSTDGGASWVTPERLTPRTTPAKDWTFASISPTNDNTIDNYYVNIVCSQDDVPFSDVGAPPALVNPLTNAKNTFVRLTIPRTAISNIGTEVPASFRLKQNFPNPFNPTTSIRFDIPKLSNVTLKVYNVSGQEVATLVNNEVLAAGVKEVSFNGINLSSGIYFYTLIAGDFRETKKMMMIK